MSAERFVADARRLLTSLVGMGAVSAGPESVGTARSLAGRARGLGLAELGGHFEALAAGLEARGALAFEPSVELAHEVCAIHDRVEALAGTLSLWGVEAAFAVGEGGGG